MKWYPSKTQWKKWSLPSKVGYVAFIIAIVALICTVVTLIVQIEFSATKENQNEILSGQEDIKLSENEQLQNQEEILLLLHKYMNEIEDGQQEKLLLKYPLGYCLYAIDHTNIIIPNDSVLKSDWEIDWNNAEAHVTQTTIEMRLPDIIGPNAAILGSFMTIER